MGQWRDDLQMIAGLLGAGMDTQGGFQMLMDANAQRDARQDERKMMVNQLAQTYTPATATTTYDDLSQQLNQVAPAMGIGQGVVNKTLNRMKPLYEYGTDNVSVLAASWDEEDDGLIMEDIKRLVQSDPRFLQNRALLRDTIRTEWSEKLGPEIMADLDEQFDTAINKGYTAIGGQEADTDSGLHATEYDKAQAAAKGMDLREYMGAQEGWIGQANAQDQGGFFSGWGALDWVDDNLLFGFLDDASKVSGGEPLENPGGPDIGFHAEELPGLGADALQNLAAVGVGKALAPVFGAVGRGTANLAGRALPREANALIRGLTGVAKDDAAGLAGLAERYGQGALRLPSFRGAASRIAGKGEQVAGEAGAEAASKLATGVSPQYATAIGSAIRDVRALGALGGGVASHLPFGRLASGRGLNAFAGGGATLNPADEALSGAAGGVVDEFLDYGPQWAGAPSPAAGVGDEFLDVGPQYGGDWVADMPVPSGVDLTDIIGGPLTPEAQSIDDILRGAGITDEAMTREASGLSGIADDIVPEQELIDGATQQQWDDLAEEAFLDAQQAKLVQVREQLAAMTDDEVIEAANSGMWASDPEARHELLQEAIRVSTGSRGGAAPLAEAPATGLNSLPDSYITDDALLAEARAQHARELDWMDEANSQYDELMQMADESTPLENAQWYELDRNFQQNYGNYDDIIADDMKNIYAATRAGAQSVKGLTRAELRAAQKRVDAFLESQGMKPWGELDETEISKAVRLLANRSKGNVDAAVSLSGKGAVREAQVPPRELAEHLKEVRTLKRKSPTNEDVYWTKDENDKWLSVPKEGQRASDIAGKEAVPNSSLIDDLVETNISSDISIADEQLIREAADAMSPNELWETFGVDSVKDLMDSIRMGLTDITEIKSQLWLRRIQALLKGQVPEETSLGLKGISTGPEPQVVKPRTPITEFDADPLPPEISLDDQLRQWLAIHKRV